MRLNSNKCVLFKDNDCNLVVLTRSEQKELAKDRIKLIQSENFNGNDEVFRVKNWNLPLRQFCHLCVQ